MNDGLKRVCNSQVSVSRYRITNYVALEPEGSATYSQEPTTGPYPEPV
jgi:hypothetical protein